MREYISREAALMAIYTSTAPALEVKAIPAADVVEVRHSHWNEEGLSLVCADCGWMQYHDIPYGYCPNCGAKMDGGQDE